MVANGVWQGEILSPDFFIVSIDELMAAIVKSRHRLSLERTVCWLPMLMQMILLYLPLQLMHLEECWRNAHEFADKRSLVFNAVKTQLICFHQCRSIVVNDCIELYGKNLCFFDTVSHLGHNLSCDLSDSADIEKKTKVYLVCQLPPVELWECALLL